MTNGEKLKEIFPNIIKYGNILIDDIGVLQKNILFDDTWWNAEYKESTTKNCKPCEYYGSHHKVCNYCYKSSLWTEKEPTTKNDLADDCISRADAIKAMQNKAKKLKNEDTINGLCGAVAILFDLPSVTPQEPKTGHWIDDMSLGYHVSICSNCNWRGHGDTCLIYKPKYCPNCGTYMRSNTTREGKPKEGNNESYNCENWIP